MRAAADERILVVFSPDSTRTRRYRLALDALASLGVVPVTYRWVRPRAAQVEEMYAANRAAAGAADHGRIDEHRRARLRERLVDDLFTSDWSLACLLQSPALRGCALGELLSVLKGPADPAQLRPGHLRWLLGAENLVMNGVHVADSEEHAVREAAVLGLDPNSPPPEGGPEESEPTDLGWDRSASALHVGFRLRRQLLGRTVGERSPRLLALLQAEDDLAASPHKPSGVLSRLGEIHQEQHAELSGLNLSLETEALVAAVAVACTGTFDLAPLEAVLTSAELSVSAWDRLVLACQRDQGALPGW